MLRIDIVTVGKLKEKFYVGACDEYIKRLGRDCDLKVWELDECRLPQEPSEAEIRAALQKEAEAVKKKLPKGAYIIAMCVEGKLLSSPQLAELMNRKTVEGCSSIVFLVGSSYGMSDELKRMADMKLSMSPMTFPHHLARVMLLEQIYRAFRINGGSDYHK